MIEAGVTPEFASVVVTERGKRRKKSMEKKRKRKRKWKKKQTPFINLAGLLSSKSSPRGSDPHKVYCEKKKKPNNPLFRDVIRLRKR